MKTYFLTISGLLLSIYSFGQERMAFGFHITPLHNYRSIHSTNSLWNDIFVDELNSIERPNSGLSYGLSFEIEVAKRFHVKTGIEKTALSEIVTREFSMPSQQGIITFSKDFYNRYQYIGMPLAVTYDVISHPSWNIGLFFSLRLDRLIQYDIEAYSLRNDNSLSTWLYNKYVFGSSVGINFEYLTKKISLYANPGYFRYLTPNAHYSYSDTTNFFSVPISTDIRQHNYYFFVSFGVKYRIYNR